MKSASWKMLKWPLIAASVIVVLVVCSGWAHSVHSAREAHQADFFREGGRVFHVETRTGPGMRAMQRDGGFSVAGMHREGGFAFAGMLMKVGLLLIGALLFAKGKGLPKWAGGLLAALAAWSLLSFWTILAAAVVIAAYVLMRGRARGHAPHEAAASAEWLAAPSSYDQIHVLDQWERQLDKEAQR